MTEFNGVRSSWLTLARNSLFAFEASVSARFASWSMRLAASRP
jgi:hypothetical protein